MTDPRRERYHGAILFTSGMLCFAVMGTLVKALSSHLPPQEIAFFRVAINVVFVVPLMLWRRISFIGRRPKLLLRRSLAGCAALTLSFFAVTQIRLVDATVLHKTSVFFTPLLAALMLKEKLSPRVLLISSIGFLGASFIIKPTFDVLNVGGLAGVGAGFLAAIVMVTIRELQESEDSLTIVFSFCATSTIVLAILFAHRFVMPSNDHWIRLLALGTAGTFGQILFTRAYRYATASFLAPLSLVEVLMAATVGFVFFREIPDLLSLCGAVLIVGAGFLLLLPKRVILPLER